GVLREGVAPAVDRTGGPLAHPSKRPLAHPSEGPSRGPCPEGGPYREEGREASLGLQPLQVSASTLGESLVSPISRPVPGGPEEFLSIDRPVLHSGPTVGKVVVIRIFLFRYSAVRLEPSCSLESEERLPNLRCVVEL